MLQRPERQQNAAVISFKHRMILIAGTGYTGKSRKAFFLF
jgi:phosphoenolpyruvate carboxykinase (ATP)